MKLKEVLNHTRFERITFRSGGGRAAVAPAVPIQNALNQIFSIISFCVLAYIINFVTYLACALF